MPLGPVWAPEINCPRFRETKTAAANDKVRTDFVCRLKKGTYTFSVYATDPAGNVQLRPAVNKLVVK